ncbi:MAG: FtsX-like permease family protein [Catenulispora sp.]|nr:FtsX-like permease family protein [Catenulispora sp.]
MFRLALSSLRHRVGGFAASFLNVFLGAALLMAFASLLDTAGGAGVSHDDKNSLTTIAYVVGGWGVVVVAFGVAATLGLSVRQRASEIALLKSAGATPKQVGRMVVGEATVVSGLAAALAVVPAYFAGRLLLTALTHAHEVADGITYKFGPMALAFGLGDAFVAGCVAAAIAARRAARQSTKDALVSASADDSRLSRKRIVWGLIFLVVGVDAGVLSGTVFKNKGFVSMSLAGEGIVWTSIALAVFAPALLRRAGLVFGQPLRATGGSGGYLAYLNLRQRSNHLAGALMPAVLLTGLAAGSMYLQRIRTLALKATGVTQTADDRGVNTLNFVIVAMIAVFAAVALLNIAITTTAFRRREFGQQRLVGSTRGQVLRMVAMESLVTGLTALVLGTVAAVAGVLPFTLGTKGASIGSAGPLIYVVVAAAVLVLTLVANVGAAARATRVPAAEAVAAV